MIASSLGEAIVLKTPLNLHNAASWRGQRVGLLGGSFNPPHAGHLHIARVALRMLKLDAVWWLVSPGNPLKDPEDYAPLADRFAACQAMLADEPQMLATDIEGALGTSRSFDTLTALKSCFAQTDFIFLMGSDSAQAFHRWYRWREIPEVMALSVLARPPAGDLSRMFPLKMSSLAHRDLSRAEKVPLIPGTCYWMSRHPLHSLSSSSIRKSL